MNAANTTSDLSHHIRACLPKLRSFSMSLTRDRTSAEDLVQEAVARALAHSDQFKPNTNFNAWIMTIARNCYFSELRQRRWTTYMSPEQPSLDRPVSGGQEARLEMRDFERAFKVLRTEHREALLLVGANGFSYEDAAQAAGCAVGTMKSRVSRGRALLQQLLDPETDESAILAMAANLVSKARVETDTRAN